MAQQPQSALERALAEMMARYQTNMGNNYANAISVVNAQQSAKDPNYAAGMIAGKLLRDGFKSWKQNYDQRGADKAALQNQISTLLRNKYGDNADAAIADLKNQGVWDNYRKLQKTFPQAQSALSQGMLGGNNPLTAAADANQPMVNAPFADLTEEDLLKRLRGGF